MKKDFTYAPSPPGTTKNGIAKMRQISSIRRVHEDLDQQLETLLSDRAVAHPKMMVGQLGLFKNKKITR